MSGVQSVLGVIVEEAGNHGRFMRSFIPCDLFRHVRWGVRGGGGSRERTPPPELGKLFQNHAVLRPKSLYP